MSSPPPEPWHTVHTDFCGPLSTGEYLLVVIDAYSWFPEVDVVRSTSAVPNYIASWLLMVFLLFCSDNGPPFKSYEIEEYMKHSGIQHNRITPLWPQANVEAERFMKLLMKAVCSAHTEGKQWKKHLYQFLLNYWTTPHATNGHAPATLLFGRNVWNKLPHVTATLDFDKEVQEADQKAKRKMKESADTKRRARTSSIAIGQTVLVRQRKENKFSTWFDTWPFKVVRKSGTMVTTYRNRKYITRNISLFKAVDKRMRKENEEKDELDDLSDDEDIPDENETRQLTANADCEPPAVNAPRRSTRWRTTTIRYGPFVEHWSEARRCNGLRNWLIFIVSYYTDIVIYKKNNFGIHMSDS